MADRVTPNRSAMAWRRSPARYARARRVRSTLRGLGISKHRIEIVEIGLSRESKSQFPGAVLDTPRPTHHGVPHAQLPARLGRFPTPRLMTQPRPNLALALFAVVCHAAGTNLWEPVGVLFSTPGALHSSPPYPHYRPGQVLLHTPRRRTALQARLTASRPDHPDATAVLARVSGVPGVCGNGNLFAPAPRQGVAGHTRVGAVPPLEGQPIALGHSTVHVPERDPAGDEGLGVFERHARTPDQ